MNERSKGFITLTLKWSYIRDDIQRIVKERGSVEQKELVKLLQAHAKKKNQSIDMRTFMDVVNTFEGIGGSFDPLPCVRPIRNHGTVVYVYDQQYRPQYQY